MKIILKLIYCSINYFTLFGFSITNRYETAISHYNSKRAVSASSNTLENK